MVRNIVESEPSQGRVTAKAWLRLLALTASSSGCTPVFFNADPTRTGVKARTSVVRRIASCNCSKVGSSSMRKMSAISSSTCDTRAPSQPHPHPHPHPHPQPQPQPQPQHHHHPSDRGAGGSARRMQAGVGTIPPQKKPHGPAKI